MLVEALRSRFRVAPRDITAAVRRLDNRETLHEIFRQVLSGATLETVRAMLRLEPRES